MKTSTVVLSVSFLVGLVVAVILGVYLVAMVCFVIQNKGDTGIIAYIPRWIFWLTPLVLLGMTQTVKDTIRKINGSLDNLLDFEGRKQRRREKLPWWER